MPTLQLLQSYLDEIGHAVMRGDWETSAARELRAARKGVLRLLDDQLAAHWPVDDLTWASAVDMKGLENRFVCVIDIDELESQIDIDQLYVTLSRPRAGLWVATRPQVGARIAELYKEHAAGALEALTKAGT